MTAKAIESFIKAKPFEPFLLVLSSGDRYVVEHPENCVLMKDRILVAFSSSPKETRPDELAILSYLHIAAAEPSKKMNSQ